MIYFFFNDTATTEIYTLSLHDALPISSSALRRSYASCVSQVVCSTWFVSVVTNGSSGTDMRNGRRRAGVRARLDRKSTRLNSSHANISYAVFCLKKKK